MSIAKTPQPPYFAVIFTSIRTDVKEGYREMAEKMEALAKIQEGFLGSESARDGLGIIVSYWKDLESIRKWKHQTDHLIAQERGKSSWYQKYCTRISYVSRDYFFEKD